MSWTQKAHRVFTGFHHHHLPSLTLTPAAVPRRCWAFCTINVNYIAWTSVPTGTGSAPRAAGAALEQNGTAYMSTLIPDTQAFWDYSGTYPAGCSIPREEPQLSGYREFKHC